MRKWFTGRSRQMIIGGAALVVAVLIGVVWAVVDSGDPALGEPEGPDSEASAPVAGAEPTTTTEAGHPSSSLPGSLPENPDAETTTTLVGTSGSSAGGGTGAASSPTAPPNQAPIIVDPGLSSDGMVLFVRPTFAEPEGEEIKVIYFLNGIEAGAGLSLTGSYDEEVVGYTHDVEVGIEVTDTAGNTTSETYTHRLEAITTVVVSNVKFRVTTPALCFESTAAQRFGGTLSFGGTIDEDVQFSEELRSDRTEVVLVELMSGETVGSPGGLDISLIGGIDGTLEAYEESHDEDDSVLQRMFEDTDCRAFFSYNLEVTTR